MVALVPVIFATLDDVILMAGSGVVTIATLLGAETIPAASRAATV
jgi:hypothetical protein